MHCVIRAGNSLPMARLPLDPIHEDGSSAYKNVQQEYGSQDAPHPQPAAGTMEDVTASRTLSQTAKLEDKKNSRKRKRPETASRKDAPARKSTRLHNNGEQDHIVIYADQRSCRAVNPPAGLKRVPYKKEVARLGGDRRRKDNLIIDMTNPAFRPKQEKFSSKTSIKNIDKELIRASGTDQKVIEPIEVDAFIQQPSGSRDALEDRGELMWKGDARVDYRVIDQVLAAVRVQFRGRFPADAVLRRLVECKYNVNEMLAELELEREQRLPQPFKRPTPAMDKNLNEQMNALRCLHRSGSGSRMLRNVQEKAMPDYYLGEIITYYYELKMKSCVNQPMVTCACRERLTSEEVEVESVECTNCTAYIWPGRSPKRLCLICKLYQERNAGMLRPMKGKLEEGNEELVRLWKKTQEESGRTYSLAQVTSKLKEANAFNGLEESRPPLKGCSVLNEKIPLAKEALLKEFSSQEKSYLVKGFSQYGLRFDKIAAELPAYLSLNTFHVRVFYQKFKHQYGLDRMMKAKRNREIKRTTLIAKNQESSVSST